MVSDFDVGLPPPAVVGCAVLEDVVRRLRAAGCVFAEDEAELLVAEAPTAAELTALVDRRAAGEPLEQVLGWAEFCGLRIRLLPGVFVPRRRTALLVREAAALVATGSTVVDLCCGSGAVGAALLAAAPGLDLHAADVAPEAVACARRNLPGPVHLGDLYDALPEQLAGRVDVVLANAPYVPSDAVALLPPEAREHEPRLALDGGPAGVDLHRRIAQDAPRWLAPGGWLLIETSTGQAALTAAAVTDAGLPARAVGDDDLGATVVVGGPASR